MGLGVGLSVLTASRHDPAAQAITAAMVGNEKGLPDLRSFAKNCDVVTFDHEHVPQEHLKALEADGHIIRPGSHALLHAQDKSVMRSRLEAMGIPGPRHRIVTDPADVAAFAAEVHANRGNVVLKTTRGGYDGKGVWLIDADTSAAVLAEPFEAGVPVLAEERVDHVRELSALIARSPYGQAVAYPIVESVQRDGICMEVVAPAPGLAPQLASQAQRIALSVAAGLDVVGVLAVELFETPDGRVVVNELAMRPHNTGHWTIDGAVTSQFENHLRAVLDLPLGSPAARAPYTVMVNILGGNLPDTYPAYRHVMARDPSLKVHWYGKDVRPGRKVGHVTAYGDDLVDLRERAWHAADYIRGDVEW
jgi:5-(carboxyamino)imidazole ribonucleotide synthase